MSKIEKTTHRKLTEGRKNKMKKIPNFYKGYTIHPTDCSDLYITGPNPTTFDRSELVKNQNGTIKYFKAR